MGTRKKKLMVRIIIYDAMQTYGGLSLQLLQILKCLQILVYDFLHFSVRRFWKVIRALNDISF